MSIAKRERWTEDEVLAFPAGEHDYFDRKSGALLTDKNFEKDLAKALSAFSNSGGGHLLLGVEDGGTFDGVPKIHKGRQSTREWLEQVAPYLVDYPLQDIRVHEVEPSTPSAIPPGKVIIVVDVGDSILAPHQSTIDHLYYHRIGGHSRPARHFYLDTLRGRERYPSQEIARTWCYAVLNPLVNSLTKEQEYLESGKWTWSVSSRSLPELMYISGFGTQTGNHEEFIEFYPDVSNEIIEHDLLVNALYARCLALYEAVASSGQLLDAYQQSISPGELQRLRDSDRRLTPYETDDALLGELFGSSSTEEENLKELAEYVVNRGINHNSTVRPLWIMHKDAFLQVLNLPPVNSLDSEAVGARDELQRFDEQFINRLKVIRKQLARKHGIPIEEQHKRVW